MIKFKLNKIVIYNFACFFGKNILDFSNETENNIFLFNIPSGFGKASLYHAIKWGFYGNEVEYYKDSKKIEPSSFLDDHLDKTDSFYVELFFSYGDNEYYLKRTFWPSKKETRLSLTKDGEVIKEELNSILPVDYADFFMIDGERLSRFSSSERDFKNNFSKEIKKLDQNKKLEIVKDVFNDINKHKGLIFKSDETFPFMIKNKDNKVITNPSKGERQVMIMSFLIGFSKYTGMNTILINNPMAHLDDIQSEGLVEALSKLNNQVILLTGFGELSDDLYKVMSAHIAKEFAVKRDKYKSKFEEV